MRLLVDGFNMALRKGTGIASYGRSFLQAAHDLGHRTELLLGESLTDAPTPTARKIIDYLMSPLGHRPRSISRDDLSIGLQALSPAVDAYWNKARLFRAARGAFRRTGLFTPVRMPGVDVAHWTYPLPLFVPGARNIYTIHDIVPIKFPAMSSGSEDYLRTCHAITKRADHILTVSEASRTDLIEHFALDPERISNSYQALSAWHGIATEENETIDRLLGRWQLTDRGYFLFFGAIEPKKNVARLLEAFVTSESEAPLVLVSGGGWDNATERAMLERLTVAGAHPRIILIDYLPRSELAHIIRHARATIFPSLYEGFGLPALESMTMGTPVITSDRGALPEIVGDAALLIDPLSVGSISDAIRRINNDAVLRDSLKYKGVQRAQLFSMDAYRVRIGKLFERWS
ncbi:glycosyltransferase family 4 protein [Sphingomonas bisphenolicum]